MDNSKINQIKKTLSHHICQFNAVIEIKKWKIGSTLITFQSKMIKASAKNYSYQSTSKFMEVSLLTKDNFKARFSF